jgi:hypothetical protein
MEKSIAFLDDITQKYRKSPRLRAFSTNFPNNFYQGLTDKNGVDEVFIVCVFLLLVKYSQEGLLDFLFESFWYLRPFLVV